MLHTEIQTALDAINSAAARVASALGKATELTDEDKAALATIVTAANAIAPEAVTPVA